MKRRLQGRQYDKIEDYLLDYYYNGYLGTLYDIHVQGIPLIFPIEQEQVLKAFTIDIKLSKKIYERLGD